MYLGNGSKMQTLTSAFLLPKQFISRASGHSGLFRLWAILFVFGVIGRATPLMAQFSGNIQGTIVDATGAVIPSVQVNLLNIEKKCESDGVN